MSDAWVGVVGTLLGAGLGASVALITEGFRSRREKASRFLDDRRKLYAKWVQVLLEWDNVIVRVGREAERDPKRVKLSPELHSEVSVGWDAISDTYAELVLLVGPRVLGVFANQGEVLMTALGSGKEDFRGMVARFREAETTLTTLQEQFIKAARKELGTNAGF
jgi:hypothetical protein